MRLVKGFTDDVYTKLRPYITIYGDAQVNVNTASRDVLVALGLNEVLADKILSVRRGVDGIDNTADDYVFQKTYDVASEIKSFVKLDDAEIHAIDLLNQTNRIKTFSTIYDIFAVAQLENRQEFLSGECVYDTAKRKVEYWHEKY